MTVVCIVFSECEQTYKRHRGDRIGQSEALHPRRNFAGRTLALFNEIIKKFKLNYNRTI